jgi:hypothetical protein
MKTTNNYGMKQPEINSTTDTIDDAVNGIGYNAGVCDSQLKKINDSLQIGADNTINIQGMTVWGSQSVINFAPINSSHQSRILSYTGTQPSGNIFIEPQNYFVMRSLFSTATENKPVNGTIYGNLNVTGNFGVGGAKNRLVQTKSYGQVGLNAIESTECWFTDIGEGILVNGECKIEFDKKFLETININVPYQVKVWAYDGGNVTVYKKDMYSDCFIVKKKNDSVDCHFAYEIYAKQLGYEDVRLKEIDDIETQNKKIEKKNAELLAEYKKTEINKQRYMINNNQNSGE